MAARLHKEGTHGETPSRLSRVQIHRRPIQPLLHYTTPDPSIKLAGPATPSSGPIVLVRGSRQARSLRPASAGLSLVITTIPRAGICARGGDFPCVFHSADTDSTTSIAKMMGGCQDRFHALRLWRICRNKRKGSMNLVARLPSTLCSEVSRSQDLAWIRFAEHVTP